MYFWNILCLWIKSLYIMTQRNILTLIITVFIFILQAIQSTKQFTSSCQCNIESKLCYLGYIIDDQIQSMSAVFPEGAAPGSRCLSWQYPTSSLHWQGVVNDMYRKTCSKWKPPWCLLHVELAVSACPFTHHPSLSPPPASHRLQVNEVWGLNEGLNMLTN